jgi:hypothetical protein
MLEFLRGRHFVFLLFLTFCFVHVAMGQQPLKVKIESPELDRKTLIEKLNDHGASHHLKFELADQDFDYRIVFGTGQEPVMSAYGSINSSGSVTRVFDAKGSELFEFKREGRWTDNGATNAAAKEIIKRLLKLTQHK